MVNTVSLRADDRVRIVMVFITTLVLLLMLMTCVRFVLSVGLCLYSSVTVGR